MLKVYTYNITIKREDGTERTETRQKKYTLKKAPLSDEDKQKIIQDLAYGVKVQVLAARYGVSDFRIRKAGGIN